MTKSRLVNRIDEANWRVLNRLELGVRTVSLTTFTFRVTVGFGRWWIDQARGNTQLVNGEQYCRRRNSQRHCYETCVWFDDGRYTAQHVQGRYVECGVQVLKKGRQQRTFTGRCNICARVVSFQKKKSGLRMIYMCVGASMNFSILNFSQMTQSLWTNMT